MLAGGHANKPTISRGYIKTFGKAGISWDAAPDAVQKLSTEASGLTMLNMVAFDLVAGEGFEPPNSKRRDLQSPAFGRFAIPPFGRVPL